MNTISYNDYFLGKLSEFLIANTLFSKYILYYQRAITKNILSSTCFVMLQMNTIQMILNFLFQQNVFIQYNSVMRVAPIFYYN